MKKDLAVIFGLFLIIIILLIFGGSFSTIGFISQNSGSKSASELTSKTTAPVQVRTLLIDAKVANTLPLRKKGLSKVNSLPLDQGMLFLFDHSDKYAIWMKDMRFAIDIIWLDEHKRIVQIAKDVPPEPGKKDGQLTIYKSGLDSRYVLEINAGLSSLHDVQIGDLVSFVL